MEAMEKTVMVYRLSQRFGFDSDEALRFLAEPMLAEEPPMLFTPDYIIARIQSIGAAEPPREEEGRVYPALPLVSETMDCDEDSLSDLESVAVAEWNCVKTGITYLKSCKQNCGEEITCNCSGDVYDIETQDLIGKWNGREIVPLLSEDESDDEELRASSATAACAAPSAAPTKKRKRRSRVEGCRVLAKCLPHGTRIRTNVPRCNTQLIGVFDAFADLATTYFPHRKSIACGGEMYSLNQFNLLQMKRTRPELVLTINAWNVCECELNGEWVSMKKLPELRF